MSIEERIAAIEERLNTEAGLRASQDRDLADMSAALRSQRALLQAIAITQSEHAQLMDRQRELLDSHSSALQRLEGGLQQIIAMLTRLDRPGSDATP